MIDTTAVQDWLKIGHADDVSVIGRVVAAVVSFVNLRCPDATEPGPSPADPRVWPATTDLAALMLAARLYRRRNSPAGIEAFTDAGATYVSRYDPDVARMLRIEGYAPPRVG